MRCRIMTTYPNKTRQNNMFLKLALKDKTFPYIIHFTKPRYENTEIDQVCKELGLSYLNVTDQEHARFRYDSRDTVSVKFNKL